MNNAKMKVGLAPWLIASPPPEDAGDGEDLRAWEARKAVLENAGAKVVIVEQDPARKSRSEASKY